MSKDLDIIYYNNTFKNKTDDQYIEANIIDYKSQPIIYNPEDFYMSVIRFSIEGSNIPIFIYASNDNGTPNNNYYFVTLSTAAFDYTKNVIYISDDNTAVVGFLQNPVYSYQTFIDMINNALQASFLSIPPLDLPVGYTSAPFLIFDNVTGIISLIADPIYSNGAIKVYFNVNLFTFFGNFQTVYTSDIGPKNYLFKIKNNGNNTITSITSPSGPVIINALEIRQEYQNLYEWSSLKKIVITSGLLPAISEFTTGKNFGDSNLNEIRIISDYIPPNDAFIGANRSVFTYIPTAEYRLTELTGNKGIDKLDFQFYWEDRFSNLRPIILSPAGVATIKILFRKKSLGYHIHKEIDYNGGRTYGYRNN